MKLLNWVHRKFRQNPNQDTKQFSADSDPGSHESNVDPPQHEWCSRFKNTRKERSAMKVATASAKPPETRSKHAVERYFHEIEPLKLGQEDAAVLVRDLQHGLLAIGTLGINELIVEEEMNEIETNSVRADSEVSPMEVQEFQEELERVFYTKDEEGRHGKQWQNKFVEIEDEKDKPEKTHYNECEGELQAGKKVFPLHEFLEIPLELPVVKKKQVILQGLSNLFSCAGPQKPLHINSNDKLANAKGNAKRVRISPFFLNKLLKLGRESEPGHPNSSNRLAKLLHLFRKKTLSKDKQRKIGDGVKTSKVRSDQSGEHYVMNNTQYQQEHDIFNRLEAFGYQNCSDECLAEERWLHQDDLWVLNSCNEYWIKTDDEYVVLEL